MPVRRIQLTDYRNYSSFFLDLDPNLNIIIGPNGAGKTNILESLIVLSNVKSFRSNDDTVLIKNDCEYARILAQADEGNFKVVISKKGKALYFNDIAVKKTSEFIGKLNCVLFKPSDLELFSQSPKERRKLLDVEMGKVYPSQLQSLLKYSALTKDKNRILKEEKIDDLYLTLIEEAMLPEIIAITEKRLQFFEEINCELADLYEKISGEKKRLEIIYKPCAPLDQIKEMMIKSREKDKIYHYATFGPHHDDYAFHMEGHEINSIASQGQKRMALIAFKIAMVHFIQNISHKAPIILLDDVLSELDEFNQQRLLALLPEDTQIIITNTDLNHVQINRKYNLIQL